MASSFLVRRTSRLKGVNIFIFYKEFVKRLNFLYIVYYLCIVLALRITCFLFYSVLILFDCRRVKRFGEWSNYIALKISFYFWWFWNCLLLTVHVSSCCNITRSANKHEQNRCDVCSPIYANKARMPCWKSHLDLKLIL